MSTGCNYFCEPENNIHAFVAKHTFNLEEARSKVGNQIPHKVPRPEHGIIAGAMVVLLSVEECPEAETPKVDDQYPYRSLCRVKVLT